MITGNNVSLRHVLVTDLSSLLEMINDLGARGPFGRTVMRSPFNFHKEFAENGLSSDAFEMLLIVDSANIVIGNLQHFTTRSYTDAREIGYQIFRESSRRKGYATEAVQLLIDNLFENRALNRLEITTDCRNLASERIAIKCGFQREGTLRGHVFSRGAYMDSTLYGLLRSDWEASRQNRISSG